MYRNTVYRDPIEYGDANVKQATDANQFLPLPCADLHILLALRGVEKHGYAMMQQVAQETNGQVRLGPATLYGTIKRLLAKGLIAESTRRRDPSRDDERRRYYRLLPLGRRVLAAELERLSSVVQIGLAAGLLKPHLS
jgi:DNA-binding PadR family transcriptional regulator